MKDLKFPKADEADICLILEGTYPFVGGGVSHWVRELIRFFPQYKFAIIFLGTSADDYEGFYSSLLDNIVHLEVHYIFEKSAHPPHSHPDIDSKTMEKIKLMHDKFANFNIENHSISELNELINDKSQINEELFCRSEEAWKMLLEVYSEKYSTQSFFDYFWAVRSLHRPFWKFADIVAKLPKVKILHSASTGYAGFLGALLQQKYKLPYIITEHGLYAKERWIELMGKYYFEHIVQAEESVDNRKDLMKIWTDFFVLLSKISYAHAKPVISLFEEYRRHQIADGAIPETTKIISYGVDFERFPYLGNKLNQKKPILAFIGRVVPIKDVKTIIRASALILSKLPEAEVWIVGSIDDDPAYVSSCRNLVSMFGLESKILFLKERPVMEEIYPKIDLLLLASISEGSPFVILECLAVGIPVIATDVGGCRELIEGKTQEDKDLGLAGRLVALADAEGMAAAAIELLSEEKLWYSAQEAAAKRVRLFYSMEKLVENYGLIYQEAIANGRNRI